MISHIIFFFPQMLCVDRRTGSESCTGYGLCRTISIQGIVIFWADKSGVGSNNIFVSYV